MQHKSGSSGKEAQGGPGKGIVNVAREFRPRKGPPIHVLFERELQEAVILVFGQELFVIPEVHRQRLIPFGGDLILGIVDHKL